jgi:glycosyltransferase involved in cell wall biosynthesis
MNGAQEPDMRVVMLIETFPPEYTGAGRQLQALAPRLAALGVDVLILTSHRGRGVVREECEGVPVVRIGVGGQEGQSASFPLRAAAWLLRHGRAFDVLHIHGLTRTAFAAIPVARVMGLRVVLKFTLAGSDDPAVVRASRMAAVKMAILRQVDRFVATSTALAGIVREAMGDDTRLSLIPNGVDVSRFAPLSKAERRASKESLCAETGWDPDAPIVAFVGSVEKRKGLDVLVAAWEAVVARYGDARLLIIGPILREHVSFRMDLEADLELRNLKGSVWFADFVETPERHLGACDAFAFPSRKEGLPNALIEAQAVGLPCVAADIPGITSDVIEEGQTGLVVPQEDPRALAEALIALLSDPERRNAMGMRARARAMTRFSIERVAEQYRDLYAGTGGKKGRTTN